jgi:hypothetical protein
MNLFCKHIFIFLQLLNDVGKSKDRNQTEGKTMSDIGHNNPPSEIDPFIAEFGDTLAEARNYLNGEAITTKGQAEAVEGFIKDLRPAKGALAKLKKAALEPSKIAGDAIKAEFKPTETDLENVKSGLAVLIQPYKDKQAKLLAEKQAEIQARAEQAAAEAAKAAAAVDATDIDAVDELREKQEAAKKLAKISKAVDKKTVAGVRLVKRHEVLDLGGLVNWIARNDKAAMTEFATEYARRNHESIPQEIVETTEEKAAY